MVSGFDLGHMIITSDNITISSCNRVPDQSMMIFPTIVDLLDGLRVFLKDKKIKQYKLVCADSSFAIFFKKKGSDICIKVDDKIVSELNEKLLAKQIYKSCDNFFLEKKIYMSENDPLIEDVEAALSSYKISLNI